MPKCEIHLLGSKIYRNKFNLRWSSRIKIDDIEIILFFSPIFIDFKLNGGNLDLSHIRSRVSRSEIFILKLMSGLKQPIHFSEINRYRQDLNLISINLSLIFVMNLFRTSLTNSGLISLSNPYNLTQPFFFSIILLKLIFTTRWQGQNLDCRWHIF